MKPKLIQVPSYGEFSFRISSETVPYFYNPFHYHEELELTYILKSQGTRFIGDHVERFDKGDLVLVGSNMPHCWKNENQYFEQESTLKAQAIVIQFKEDFAGPDFFQLSELRHILNFFKQARKGIVFYGSDKKILRKKLLALVDCSGIHRILKLVEILDLMATTTNKNFLCESYPVKQVSSEKLERLNTIFEYSLKRINEQITIEEISELVHLTPNAFCRYFKTHTRKTYKEFLNELRISRICKLLQETNRNITEIAYSNGLNNLSHFIKMFKKIKQMKPTEYRKRAQEINSII